MRLSGKLFFVLSMVAMLTACSGAAKRDAGKNFLCAAAGALVGGAATAGIDGGSGVAGGAVAGGMLALLLCPDESEAKQSIVEVPVCSVEPPPGAILDQNGCAYDSDGDGVYAGIDLCRNTPSGVNVDRVGCPLDSDRDAVADYLDLCPSTPLGVIVDQDGCPLPGENLLVLTDVHFQFDKATLTPDAKETLEEAVSLLKETDQIIEVRVEGHTDNIGTEAYNQDLSQRRAQSVVDYLTSRGIDGRYLLPIGLGENFPIADNSTDAGRALNRRVEFDVHQ